MKRLVYTRCGVVVVYTRHGVLVYTRHGVSVVYTRHGVLVYTRHGVLYSQKMAWVIVHHCCFFL
jgi:hypothetical protein